MGCKGCGGGHGRGRALTHPPGTVVLDRAMRRRGWALPSVDPRPSNGRGHRLNQPPGEVMLGSNRARVPIKIAAYVKYVGAIRYSVHGPHTKQPYGPVRPGDVIAVYPEDGPAMTRRPSFEDASPDERLNAINSAEPRCPRDGSLVRFAVRPRPTANGGNKND